MTYYVNGDNKIQAFGVTEDTVNDPVSHPSHYTQGSIECIDYITDKNLDFCKGNAVKYITRSGLKDDEVQDLQKAIWYLNKEIDLINKERAKKVAQ